MACTPLPLSCLPSFPFLSFPSLSTSLIPCLPPSLSASHILSHTLTRPLHPSLPLSPPASVLTLSVCCHSPGESQINSSAAGGSHGFIKAGCVTAAVWDKPCVPCSPTGYWKNRKHLLWNWADLSRVYAWKLDRGYRRMLVCVLLSLDNVCSLSRHRLCACPPPQREIGRASCRERV